MGETILKTPDEIRVMLCDECKKWRVGGQKILAANLGVSQAFLSAVIHGKKLPSENVASFFGYVPVTMYAKAGTAPPSKQRSNALWP